VFRRWLLALICCFVGTVVSILCTDHPLADFFGAYVAHTTARYWLDRLLGPLVLFPVAALLFLFACGCWRISGRKLAAWTRPLLLCSWSATWALAAEFAFKQLFSRLPHGGPHLNQFPSGTATISVAAAATIWLVAPRLRIPAALMTTCACVAVVVTNGHWLSDVIAGAFLGLSIGWMTPGLLERSRENSDANAR
jgi:membrane-associated phospholipid phosphatase